VHWYEVTLDSKLSCVRLVRDVPPDFILCERGTPFEFCRFGRVQQRGLRSGFVYCAVSGPVAI
jgi:hypothetical protein